MLYHYYAVTNLDGPVSKFLGDTELTAIFKFRHMAPETLLPSDSLPRDAEDDVIMYDCAHMDASEFSVILREHGFVPLADLGPVCHGPDGREIQYPRQNRWTLWVVRVDK
jgi:hypothetical protein